MNSDAKQLAVIGGTITAGDTVSMNFSDFGLSGWIETELLYRTVLSSDTPTSIGLRLQLSML
jgi:hypothetical protein